MLKRINLDNKEIGFFIVSTETGKIKSSGDINDDTWEDTYMDLKTVIVGGIPFISFNKARKARYINREPVFIDLNYKITSIEDIKETKLI